MSIVLILAALASSAIVLARLARPARKGSWRIEWYMEEARAHFDRAAG
ncbi:hypothetical protein [Sphingomonas sp. MMS24-J13]